MPLMHCFSELEIVRLKVVLEVNYFLFPFFFFIMCLLCEYDRYCAGRNSDIDLHHPSFFWTVSTNESCSSCY